jgi:peptide/nickel transport system ATP-binding protein
MQDLVEITALDRHSPQMRALRGGKIGMIFQEPMTSLNPSYTIGNQLGEAITLHRAMSQKEAIDQAIAILKRVGMPLPQDVVKRYPHELSGGMRQRVMIAMALSCSPAILIADEPTTALDVTTEAQILDLIRELQADLGMTSMFITHNLGVVAQTCDDVAVMYLGRIVERADVDSIFYNPRHPYTQALLQSIPRIGSRTRQRLAPIRGIVPDPYSKITGCPFHPRCDAARPSVCDRQMPALMHVNPQHSVRCFLHSDEAEDNHGRE